LLERILGKNLVKLGMFGCWESGEGRGGDGIEDVRPRKVRMGTFCWRMAESAANGDSWGIVMGIEVE
jgi:hypothetical protein